MISVLLTEFLHCLLDLHIKKKLFIYGYAGSLFRTPAFSSCSDWRLLSSSGALASHCNGFSYGREWFLGHVGSAVVACRL